MNQKLPSERNHRLRGAGDLASGIALRLWRSGYRVILSELPCPLCIRRRWRLPMRSMKAIWRSRASKAS